MGVHDKTHEGTGSCGYGDFYKNLHDRGDYKSGWQIEKEYAEKEKKRQKRLLEGRDPDEESDDEDKKAAKSDKEEQFACTICRSPFHNAVETICGHFFCEACALKHFKKTSRCFNCKKQTNGVFNAAEKLRAKEQAEKQQASSSGDKSAEPKNNADSPVETQDNNSSAGGWTTVAESMK
ncbi:hypothetical protein PHYSODRAFT_348645 [Phytophthora sojae]|uniref:RING-type domain-containing protein n=1 Tax=Phytophthora sojae (strain P6497) TaxID=1094619 RepID=G5AH89_PHYSP|nr:hypothetical protein PHYSODRAFT_348645 [Phytophthora sojae]EGZ05068.1 hypothetical protein PHYSODRAFT_348645 [Phytophthora sojae]|eukprot:XP_009539440.1 hypothetical protein PHYSODRAFT_348645 [Phytophthora sojae]